MAQWYDIFVVEDVGPIYEHFDRIIIQLRELEAAGVAGIAGAGFLARVQKSLLNFMDGLELAARTAAVQAQQEIVGKIAATQVRPDTGRRPGLAAAIRTAVLEPRGGLPTGAVGVGNINTLDRLTTRSGRMARYGPYWRSQEYGFRPRGRQLSGIRGFFTGPGFGNVAPSPGAFRDQPTFEARRGGPLMRPSGYQGRFFLRDGSAAAFAAYKRELLALQDRIDAELAPILRY
jgi:hypothetical protein